MNRAKSPDSTGEGVIAGGAPDVIPPARETPEPADGGVAGATSATAAEPAATPRAGLEQCPKCATVLAHDHLGAYCVACGYPRNQERPVRPPELLAYLERLRRGDQRADARALIALARDAGLRWGSPELKPGPRLRLEVPDGPALAIQEAVGSDKYLVVVCGEASWLPGFHQFFDVAEAPGSGLARVRLRREAVARLEDSGSLRCLEPGELEVAAVPPPAVRSTPVAITSAPSAVQQVEPIPRPSPRRWAVAAALFAGSILALLIFQAVKGGGDAVTAPPSTPVETTFPSVSTAGSTTMQRPGQGTGSLEVRTNCQALGNLNSFVLPEGKLRRSSRLEWYNLPARAHRLKVTCVGFEDATRKVSINEGEHVVLDVELRPL